MLLREGSQSAENHGQHLLNREHATICANADRTTSDHNTLLPFQAGFHKYQMQPVVTEPDQSPMAGRIGAGLPAPEYCNGWQAMPHLSDNGQNQAGYGQARPVWAGNTLSPFAIYGLLPAADLSLHHWQNNRRYAGCGETGERLPVACRDCVRPASALPDSTPASVGAVVGEFCFGSPYLVIE